MAEIDQPCSRSAVASMSSFPVNMREVLLPRLWLGHQKLRKGAPSVVDRQFTGGSEVGNFNEQVWGELRERGQPVLDRVLATVVFTDIVGSTGHAKTLGDHRWKDMLTDYDDVVHRELDRFRGRYVKSTGDGTLRDLRRSGASNQGHASDPRGGQGLRYRDP